MKMTYGPTRLQKLGGNKKGILKPDSKGYYTMIVGALDAVNTNGSRYLGKENTVHFEPSSSFQKRLAEGQCYGESGHPVKSARQTLGDFIKRVLNVETKNHCVHWKRVTLDDSISKSSSNELQSGSIAMIGTFKPAGIYGPSLEKSMQNPDENIAFSIRSLTDDKNVGGMTVKKITTMVTLDRVVGPGMLGSSKWNAPSLEDDLIFTHDIIGDLEESIETIALESDRKLIAEVVSKMKTNQNVNDFWKNDVEPSYFNWK